MTKDTPPFFHKFESEITNHTLPAKFTFPFCYDPDFLSSQASLELQHYLENQTDFDHNFGLQSKAGLVIGKMFGVLVVQTKNQELGYLASFSGKLAGGNQHHFFVPPVFDMLTEGSFYLEEEIQINALNRNIETLESSEILSEKRALFSKFQSQAENELSEFRQQMKILKAERKSIRELNKDTLSVDQYNILIEDLIKQSYRDQHEQQVLKSRWKDKLENLRSDIENLEFEIESLREFRRSKSSTLQQKLFDQYRFLNVLGELKSLLDIFDTKNGHIPPAGAGECAAPKLLQYAFLNNLKPISMAEFWWGTSPSSEIRKHKNFYPACKSKCEPILSHMLKGIRVAPNPLLVNPAQDKEIELIYEDNSIIVVNKPEEFLSVPGIHIQDSVYKRIMTRYPDITGPVIIHRLDMSTSGIIIIAKNKASHQFIQKQFIDHTIIKRYTALIEGELNRDKGTIDLPLRVDLDDRPRQMVCYEYGKPAKTNFKVVGYENGNTRIHFFPLTGRTHQLRVHSAHLLGLNHAIVGDDLYGKKANRLHLHAGYIEFTHPETFKTVSFTVSDPF